MEVDVVDLKSECKDNTVSIMFKVLVVGISAREFVANTPIFVRWPGRDSKQGHGYLSSYLPKMSAQSF